jgi:hypothetical protein
MNTVLQCPVSIVAETISHLQEGGKRNNETVVLWLGRDVGEGIQITDVYLPQQEVSIDYFRIPASSMRLLMAELRRSRTKIVAQVHSHPGLAFHSFADDAWAVVRHIGALSLVLPRFASDTCVADFSKKASVYQLDATDSWREVQFDHVLQIVK